MFKHKNFYVTYLIIIPMLLPIITAPAEMSSEAKIWTSKSGSFIVGMLYDVRDDFVLIREMNGQMRNIKLENLMTHDQRYVISHVKDARHLQRLKQISDVVFFNESINVNLNRTTLSPKNNDHEIPLRTENNSNVRYRPRVPSTNYSAKNSDSDEQPENKSSYEIDWGTKRERFFSSINELKGDLFRTFVFCIFLVMTMIIFTYLIIGEIQKCGERSILFEKFILVFSSVTQVYFVFSIFRLVFSETFFWLDCPILGLIIE